MAKVKVGDYELVLSAGEMLALTALLGGLSEHQTVETLKASSSLMRASDEELEAAKQDLHAIWVAVDTAMKNRR